MKTESEKYAQDCWAWSLGDCGGGISREHYVSQSVFPDQSIFVQGLDWCLDKAKEIRIERLTAKILCKHHNTALSELDAAAGAAFKSIQDYVATTNQRQAMPYLNWAPKELTIDGPKLERWCLKTLLNFSFNRQLIIGPRAHEPGKVPNDLVRIAFGIEEFTHGRGLYTAFRDNETFDLQHGFGYTAKAQGPNLAMGNFRLYGFRFYLNLLPVENQYTAIETSRVFYRQTHFAHKLGERFSHRLSIIWPAAPGRTA
ncbi:MAG: hypothetical protein ABSA39_14310 [Edaphobacter sp.]